jgi:hypothetical protein
MLVIYAYHTCHYGSTLNNTPKREGLENNNSEMTLSKTLEN